MTTSDSEGPGPTRLLGPSLGPALTLAALMLTSAACNRCTKVAESGQAIIYDGVALSGNDSLRFETAKSLIDGRLSLVPEFQCGGSPGSAVAFMPYPKWLPAGAIIKDLANYVAKDYRLPRPPRPATIKLSHFVVHGVGAQVSPHLMVIRGIVLVDDRRLVANITYPSQERVPTAIEQLFGSLRPAGKQPETLARFTLEGMVIRAPMSCLITTEPDRQGGKKVYLSSWDGHWLIRLKSRRVAESHESATKLAERLARQDRSGLQRFYSLKSPAPFEWKTLGNGAYFLTEIEQPSYSVSHGYYVQTKTVVEADITVDRSPKGLEVGDPGPMQVLATLAATGTRGSGPN